MTADTITEAELQALRDAHLQSEAERDNLIGALERVAPVAMRQLRRGVPVASLADEPHPPTGRAYLDEPPPPRVPMTLRSVVERWTTAGPVIHVPTGIPTLDAMTDGGLVLGSRVAFLGAPNAGKTLLIDQIADTYNTAGLAVGVLSVDEDPDPDSITRLLQRRAWHRREVEDRDPATLAEMLEQHGAWGSSSTMRRGRSKKQRPTSPPATKARAARSSSTRSRPSSASRSSRPSARLACARS